MVMFLRNCAIRIYSNSLLINNENTPTKIKKKKKKGKSSYYTVTPGKKTITK